MILILAILLGVLCGALIPYNVPPAFTPFLAIGLLAACNTLFGGIAARQRHKFDARAFVSGFFFNTILAILLTYAGSKLALIFLWLQLYILERVF